VQLGVVEMLLMLVHCCCSKPDQDGARCGDTHSDGLGYGADRGQQGGRGQRKGRTSGTCRQNGLLTIILVLSFLLLLLLLLLMMTYSSSRYRVRLASLTSLPGNIENVDRGSASVVLKIASCACRVPGQSSQCSRICGAWLHLGQLVSTELLLLLLLL